MTGLSKTLDGMNQTLDGMTQMKWDSLSRAEKLAIRDNSALHPKLIGLEGCKVRVAPKREYGLSTFRVGITTGWRPVHIAMRSNEHGSSDLIGKDEAITRVDVLTSKR